jgi:small subunit ribosomal protein S5
MGPPGTRTLFNINNKNKKMAIPKKVKEEVQAEELMEREMEEEEVIAEEQLKEMEAIVEGKEILKDAKVSKQADEQFKAEEGRGEYRRESREERFEREAKQKLDNWVPRTQLGREVRAGKIKDIDELLESGRKILEAEIVDLLVPGLKSDALFIGQAKGKFGGGKRRAFRQTQKKTKEGNILTFGVMAIVGDGKGHIGLGYGRAAETLPAKEKAVRKAKLNITKIPRGCGSYDCSCDDEHSIPMEISGKCSSVRVKLMPAPQGTGLVVGDQMKKILKLAGIQDVYSACSGKVQTTVNTAKACMDALNKLNGVRI